ncbi:MAG: transglycosylase domain-containing protein [Bacteroidaceae bacterium]|nr:transglycosylase domain-containing protein [Bacteroidaceae bacterium]
MRKKVIIALWIILVLVLGSAALAFWAIAEGVIGYMPDLEQLENPVNKYASQVISADGHLLGTWSYQRANRIFVRYGDIAPSTIEALVATEDERFYQHSGIDFKALMRAVVKRGILHQKSAGGGSTITQQLAKQLYSVQAHSVGERLLQKPIEWVIAVKLERFYTKEEILSMYLNYFDFLHNAVGIKTAAKTYFNKEPKDLTTTESAMLIGLCKNPSYFNPVRQPERALQRRNVVLGQMVKCGYLSETEADSLQQLPLTLNFHRVDHKQGEGTYLREYLRTVMMAKKPRRSDYASWQGQKYYEDSLAWENDPLYGWCNKNQKKDGSYYNIYTDGLKIYTTIDSRMQRYAEQAMEEHVSGYLQPLFTAERKGKANAPYSAGVSMDKYRKNLYRAMRQTERYIMMKDAGYSEQEIEKAFATPVEMTVYSPSGDVDTVMTPMDSIKYYKGFLRSGFVCMDTRTGAVKAYVGGLNYTYFQYDMAGAGRRQVGSTVKPYLYSLAMESGWSPCDLAPNVQQTYETPSGPWTPRNGSRARYGEMVTLKWGLAQSNNWISAYLMNQLSPASLVRLIHEFGILNRDIHPSLSLCLGTCDISVMEMVSAYTAFANRGIRTAPLFVTRIEDSEGNVVADESLFLPRMNEVISETSACKMVNMMRGVMDGGTGSRMRFRYNIKAPMGGKTGTTNDNSDGWFVGYTPSLSFGAWVGGEEREIHFNSMAYGQGASSALPICAKFLQRVFGDSSLGYNSSEEFTVPEGFDPCATTIYGDTPEGEDSAEPSHVGIDRLEE